MGETGQKSYDDIASLICDDIGVKLWINTIYDDFLVLFYDVPSIFVTNFQGKSSSPVTYDETKGLFGTAHNSFMSCCELFFFAKHLFLKQLYG